MKRHPRNPILTRADIPAVDPYLRDVSSVFNPGAIRIGDRDLLLLRVQTRGRETCLMAAESRNGVEFTVRPEVLTIAGAAGIEPRPLHVYDPRLTRIEGRIYVVLSVDSENGCHLLTAEMGGDLDRGLHLRLVAYSREHQSRNGVLFPERIGGRYCRLERPNQRKLPSGVVTGDKIWLSTSEDLVHWHLERPVLAGRPHYWDELIGSGPPPVRTAEGWLHLYHGVATHLGAGIYQAGVCLLDLEDPSKVVARGRNNVLEPRELWEMVGQVPNVVFPSGWIVRPARGSREDAEPPADPDWPVRLYYGAADTCVGLAETTIGELLEACRLE